MQFLVIENFRGRDPVPVYRKAIRCEMLQVAPELTPH
jgi:hypothetical protein